MKDETVRTIVCMSDDAHRELLLRALEGEPEFVVVGVAKTGREALSLANESPPGLFVVDDVDPSHNANVISAVYRLRAPVPNLVFCRDARERSPDRSSPHGRLTSYVDLGVLERDDEFARALLKGRLHTLASRDTARKRTRRDSNVDKRITEIRVDAEDAEIPERVAQLASWPLDLIVLAGGKGSVEQLRETLPAVASLPVPVLIVLDEDARREIESADRSHSGDLLQHAPAATSMLLRSARGLYLARGDEQVRVVDTMIEVMARTALDVSETIQSMGALGRTGLTILLSSDDTELATALGAAANQEGLTAVIQPQECRKDEAVSAALRWDITDVALDSRELSWLLGNALSRLN